MKKSIIQTPHRHRQQYEITGHHNPRIRTQPRRRKGRENYPRERRRIHLCRSPPCCCCSPPLLNGSKLRSTGERNEEGVGHREYGARQEIVRASGNRRYVMMPLASEYSNHQPPLTNMKYGLSKWESISSRLVHPFQKRTWVS